MASDSDNKSTDLDLAMRRAETCSGFGELANEDQRWIIVLATECRRLERERSEWAGVAATRNLNNALIAEERDDLRNLLGEWLKCLGSTNALSERTRRALRLPVDVSAPPKAKAYGPGMTPHADDCVCAVCGPPPQQFCPHCGKSEPHTHRIPGVPDPVVFPHQ